MTTTPPIPLYAALSDNPLDDFRGDATWGTIEMESDAVETIYETWSTADAQKPTDHPLYAFSDWSRIQTWAAGFKTLLQNTVGLDSNYTGWLAFDHWERFPMSWAWLKYVAENGNGNSTAAAIVTATRAAARARHPELLRMTAEARDAAVGRMYNRAVARMNSEVIRQVKSLCPSAKYLFYENMRSAFPDETNGAIIERAHDVDMAWLWGQVDAKSISIYSFYQTVESSPGAGQTTTAAAQLYMTTAVTECVRVATAHGLDASVWVHGRYHPSNATYGGQYVQDADIAMQLQTAVDGGCDGVLIWEAFADATEAAPNPIPKAVDQVTAFNAWTANNLEPVVANLTGVGA